MSDPTDRIKSRVRKLLNLANDQSAAEGEIENALRYARALMDQHHLDEADLDEEVREERMAQMIATCGGSKMSAWESALAHAIVKVIGFGWYVGKEMFEEVGKTIATMARLKWGGVYRGPGRSYCEGFAYELLNRVSREIREQRTSECKALVHQKANLARTWLREEAGVRLRSRGGGGDGGQHHHDAFGDGRRDGRQSDFQRPAPAEAGRGEDAPRMTDNTMPR